MKIRSKALLLPLCALLLVIVSALGTVAYLTSKAAVTNTFTIGQVSITMDEDSVNTRRAAAPVDGNSCTLMPGHTYAKAHTIHVDAVSEDSYIFVKVENGIAVYEAASSAEKDGYKTIADQTLSGKADKAVPAAAGNIALLNAAGSLMDSGKQLTPAAIGAAPALSRGSYFGSLSQVTNTSGGLYDNSLVWFGSSNGTTDLPKEGFGFCMTLGNTGGDLQLLFYVDGTVAVRLRYDTGSGNQWHDWVWVKS